MPLLGTKRSRLKSPGPAVSYSSRKLVALARLKKRSPTCSLPPKDSVLGKSRENVDADDPVSRSAGQAVVDGLDIKIDQPVGHLPGLRYLVADGRVAEHRYGDFVELPE